MSFNVPQPFWRWLVNGVIPIALGLVFALIYLRGLPFVPFHPDESSQLFMSRDFDTFFVRHDFAALAWQPGAPLALDMRLRLLDAPLTRYLAGFGWWARGLTVNDLNIDWVWGAAWDANEAALPHPAVLQAARLPVALLGAFTVTLLFWLGIKSGGWTTGLLAALLVGLDPLTLLHTRRTMAESELIFFSALAALGTLVLANACDRLDGFRWRVLAGALGVGVLAGLALSSKQTELVMIPVAGLACGAALVQRPWAWRKRLGMLALLCGVIGLTAGLTFFLLNPVLWSQPLAGLQTMLRMRNELVQSQIRVNGEREPQVVLTTIPARLDAMVEQLYWQTPAVWDAPVYLEHLQPAADQYFAVPFHTWLHQPPWPALLLCLTALGLGVGLCRVARSCLNSDTRALQLALFWFGVTAIFLAFVIPLDWQRYFLPLLAPTRLLAALGLSALGQKLLALARIRPAS
jgi:4-amino-4-deoxy-L-arabinose transferase-like glycosyltransferase